MCRNKPNAKVFFWYPGKTRANTTANYGFCNIFACIWSTLKTVIFAKDVNLSKLVEMLKICPRCKYVSNLCQTITFTWLLRINTYLANICICPHFSWQRKCNANLELQIYHIFAPFANVSKSVFSSSERAFTRISEVHSYPTRSSLNDDFYTEHSRL